MLFKRTGNVEPIGGNCICHGCQVAHCKHHNKINKSQPSKRQQRKHLTNGANPKICKNDQTRRRGKPYRTTCSDLDSKRPLGHGCNWKGSAPFIGLLKQPLPRHDGGLPGLELHREPNPLAPVCGRQRLLLRRSGGGGDIGRRWGLGRRRRGRGQCGKRRRRCRGSNGRGGGGGGGGSPNRGSFLVFHGERGGEFLRHRRCRGSIRVREMGGRDRIDPLRSRKAGWDGAGQGAPRGIVRCEEWS